MKRLPLLILIVLQFGAVNALKANIKRNFLDITGNTIIAPAVSVFCSVGNPGIITGSSPSGGSGIFTYQWQASTDSINFTTVAGISSINFDLPQISQTTWYRRLVTSDGDTTLSISNVVAVTIWQPVTNNTITAPVVTTFNTPSVPGVITGNTPSGDSTYTYTWQISTDNLNFTNISGAAGRDLTAPPSISQTTYFQRIVTSGACTTPVISNVVKVIVSLPITGNTIQAPAITDFCLNGDPAVIAGGTPSGGNGRYSYQWQSSTDSINFTSINGAVGISFDPPPVSQTTWYRRLVFSGLPGAAAASVDPNNIDFFLIGGQSNAVGTLSDLSLQPAIPAGICWKYENGAFTQVTTQSIGSGKHGSAWAAFVIAYYNRTGRKVCIVPGAVSASSQEAAIDDGHGNWDATGALVNNAVLMLNQGLTAAKTAGWAPVLRGILWDQGERDANGITSNLTTVDLYQAAFTNMIPRFRTMLSNSSLPFYIFRIANNKIGGLQVQGAQEAVANMDINTAVVFRDAVDFTVANGLLNPVGLVHYTQPGYNLAGQVGGDMVGAYTVPVVSNVVKIIISNPATPVLVDTLVQINSGNAATLAVAAPNNNNVYNWYDSPDATNLLFSGATYVTPPLSANKTYYVQAINGSCGISSLASVQVSIVDGLDNLQLSSGTLAPIFRTGTFNYNASVDNTVTAITLTPATSDGAATLTVNGSPVAAGTPSASIPLIVGANSITVTVTSADTTTLTYTLVVTRNLSANANLSDLQFSGGPLSPAFAGATTGYTALVAYGVSSVTISPVTSDATATITVSGVPLASGQVSAGIPLAVGLNTVTTTVTAPDGITTKAYTIAITRIAPSANASLSALQLSAGTLTPAFAATRTTYTPTVANSIASIAITPTANDATATITVNNIPVLSGNASTAIPLSVGPNTITVAVTARDGSTTKSYIVTVTRVPSTNANLLSLRLTTGPLSPVFAAATTSYTSSVSNAVSSTIVTPSAIDANATITVNGAPVNSGAAAAAIPLNVGSNTINVTTTAQDGITIKTYTIAVTRLPSANASLAGLNLSSGTLTPVFATGRYSYTATVPYPVSTMTITPTPSDTTASITANNIPVIPGQATPGFPLHIGKDTVTTTLTAQDGITVKTYTIVVTRAAPSTNASLLSLHLSAGTLSPAFTAATTSYTTSVVNSAASVTVTPTVSDATATITINNIAARSGVVSTPVPLNVGANTINVAITAQDGITIKTYTITVTRPPSSNAGLAGLSLSNGTLTPGFVTTRTAYTATVPYVVSSMTITPTASDATAIIMVNGTAVSPGAASLPVPLNVGANTITTFVTAQDGITTKTYTIVVTRGTPSTNANLSGLSLSTGILSPVFAATRIAYTATVPYLVSSITLTPTVSDTTAKIAVNGIPLVSGQASSGIPLAAGQNTITTIITAQDGITTKTYTTTVTRTLPSTNANLTGLKLSSGTLTPVFATTRTAYTATAPYLVSSITLTPTASDTTATVTVNGIPSVSGAASAVIPLTIGPNTITTTVTAQDGITTKTYTTVVTRSGASANAGLSALHLSTGILSPAFATATTGYTASVSNTVTSITITPTVSDATATTTVNGAVVNSGTASGPVPLNIGANTITTIVTAQDGITTKTYTVTVTRSLPANANLSNLSISAGTLSPVFSATTTSYTASVANTVTSVTATVKSSDALATITVNGTAVRQGSASGAIPLNAGPNTITAIVTAEDGLTTKTYTVTVTRAASTNADLTSLSISAGALTPVFSTSTTSYTASVDNSVGAITVTPTTSDGTATVTVNGTAVISGSSSGSIPLNVGANTITTIVTAQDGVTTKTYAVTVTRAASTNADLTSLSISAGTLTPVFSTSTTSYTASVDNSVGAITVTPTTSDTTAAITVNGIAVISGTASGSIPLNVGANTITTIVTAQDGVTTKTDTITVTRLPSSNANLSGVSLSAGTITPTFATGTTSYTASVDNSVSAITVTPFTGDATATVTINGTAVNSGAASGVIPLNLGANTITIIVTAQDGVTTQTYSLTVTRAPSGNSNLAGLNISAGTLSPVFATATTNYTASVVNTVSSIIITPTTSDSTATVTVNGAAVNSGTASGAMPLNLGANTIAILVTAQDGVTTQTYSVTVTRMPSTNSSLAGLTISTGTLSPVFSPSTTSYSASVANTITVVAITPTASDATATLTVNGTAVNSGAASSAISLNVGANTITTVVTAQDGATTQTYTVIVTRAPSINVNLASFSISAGTLSPAFATLTSNYTASVDNTVSTVTVTPKSSNIAATITVNGTTVRSGTASGAIPLNVGTNSIAAVVTAQDGISTKTYTVTVTRAAPGMNSVYEPVSVANPTDRPKMAANEITVHQAVSPNGDGINDFFMIDGITAYPDNKLTIMNKTGEVIFEALGYDNSTRVFDGHSNKNGTKQPPGTYFYLLEYKAGDIAKRKTGFLILKW